jgi:hypothetical protein
MARREPQQRAVSVGGSHIRALGVDSDAPTVLLAHRDTRNFMDHYFAVQLSQRGEVRSQPIMLPICGSMRRRRASTIDSVWQAAVASIAAHANATCIKGASSLDGGIAPSPTPARNVHVDVAAPNAGVDLSDPTARQSSGNSLRFGRWLCLATFGADPVGTNGLIRRSRDGVGVTRFCG